VLLQDQAVALVRNQVADIVIGTLFVFVGFAACGIATMRRRKGARTLLWLGIWSAMYGLSPLMNSLSALGILPHPLQVSVPFVDTFLRYQILVVAALAWMQLTRNKLRLFLKALAFAGLLIGLAGIAIYIFTGRDDSLILYNQLLATSALLVLIVVVALPRPSSEFLVISARGILLAGILVFAIEALYNNLVRPIGYRLSSVWDSAGFAVLLFSFGYVAVRSMVANERRLQSIEDELGIARRIQSSIIPQHCPKLNNLRITAAYRPMTYVAGDFYDFIPVDEHRVGILVADVSGHGVPAALIASMIKVAMRSVVPCASDPREVLRSLNRALFGQIRDQLITASYLWIDTEIRSALYSAAGHPPLLRWRENRLERIESNGLLFGVLPDPEYPVCNLPICSGDRFLLYTDGLIEPQNSRGDSFGDGKLEKVLRKNESCSPSELTDRLLSEICLWEAPSTTQQDDITLIVVDVT
jgi:sigma-B regulation protein RsbU (phosphoserine phosphatase)